MSAPRPAAVIVLAAGEGTRMRSARPKVLHAIGGRTLLGHAIGAARGASPRHLAVARLRFDATAPNVTTRQVPRGPSQQQKPAATPNDGTATTHPRRQISFAPLLYSAVGSFPGRKFGRARKIWPIWVHY